MVPVKVEKGEIMPVGGRLLCILVLFATFSAHAQLNIDRKTVRFGLTKAPPLSYVSNWKAAGIFGVVGTRILQEMGYIVVPVEVPFARLYESVHRDTIDIAGGVLKTEDRKQLAYYTAPLIRDYVLLAVNKQDPIVMEALSDLSGETLGIVSGFTFPGLASVPNVRFEKAEDEKAALHRLAAKRLRGVITSSIRGVTLVKKDPVLKQSIELLPLAIEEVKVGFALSQKTFSEEDLKTFNKILAHLKASPEWPQLLEKEDIAPLVRTWPVAK